MCFILFSFIATSVISQKRAEKWIFGQQGAGLDFACNPPFPFTGNIEFYSAEGCSSISDEEGNLLFYSNGTYVWNREHALMPNGSGMGVNPECWGSSTQGALIIPHPTASNLYFLFTIDCTEVGQYTDDLGLRYSIIDMNLENGLGNVTDKAIPLFGSVCEKLAAVYHQDGESVWVVVHEYGTDAFRAYLVDENGLNATPVISNTGFVQVMPDDLPSCWGISAKRGHMKFSPQGDKLVVVSASDCHPTVLPVQVFTFDDATGVVELDYTLEGSELFRYYGASFSPNGQLLYFSNAWYGFSLIHQYDVSSGDPETVTNSRVVIFESDDISAFSTGALQIGPDGKIYVSRNFNTISVIHNPNTYGAGCDFDEDYQFFATCPQNTYGIFGLPSFIESYFLDAYQSEPCFADLTANFSASLPSQEDLVQFTDLSTGYPDMPQFWSWNFDDPASGVLNFSQEQNPSHIFSGTGIYDVTLSVVSDTSLVEGSNGYPCLEDEVTFQIIISGSGIGIENIETKWNTWITEGVLHISTTDAPVELSVYDVSGKRMKHLTGLTERTVDCRDLAKGMYVVAIEFSDKKSRASRVVKLE